MIIDENYITIIKYIFTLNRLKYIFSKNRKFCNALMCHLDFLEICIENDSENKPSMNET